MDDATRALIVVLGSVGILGVGMAIWAWLQPRDGGKE
jgi:hypothetical protein